MLSDKQVRGLQYLALAFLVIWLVMKGIVPGWTRLHSDFGNYYVSAKLISTGAGLDSLYNNEWFHQQMIRHGVDTGGKFSPFPPITSWVLVPLSGLEPLTAQRVTVVINLILVMLCALVWSKIAGWKLLPSALTVLGGGASLTNNIAFGQWYLAMVVCLMIAVLLIERDRLLAAGMLIGIFTSIKYFPIVIIAGLFFLTLISRDDERRRYHLTTVYSLLTLIVLVVVQRLYFGPVIMRDYFFSAFLPHLSSELSGQGMYSYLFQSWDSLGRNIFIYDSAENPNPVVDWAAGKLFLKLLVAVVVLTTTILVLYVSARTQRHRFNVYVSMPALAMLVILPASATYHFILLLLPLVLLVRDNTVTATTKAILIGCYCSIGFIPYALAFKLSETAGLAFAYPRLWLVCLIFAVTTWALVRQPKPAAAQ